MSKMHSTSLFSTPWPFWTGIPSQASKNDDEKNVGSKSNLALEASLFMDGPLKNKYV